MHGSAQLNVRPTNIKLFPQADIVPIFLRREHPTDIWPTPPSVGHALSVRAPTVTAGGANSSSRSAAILPRLSHTCESQRSLIGLIDLGGALPGGTLFNGNLSTATVARLLHR